MNIEGQMARIGEVAMFARFDRFLEGSLVPLLRPSSNVGVINGRHARTAEVIIRLVSRAVVMVAV